MEEVRVPLRQCPVGLSDALHRVHRGGLAHVSEGQSWVTCLHVKTPFSRLDCGVELSTMGQKEVLFFSPPLTAKCLEMLLFNIKSLIIRFFSPSKPLRTLGHLQQNSSVSALISCLIKCLSFASAERLFRPSPSRAAVAAMISITSLSGMFSGQLFFSFHCSYLQI